MFEAGDFVVCIDNDGSHLILNKIYQIISIGENNLLNIMISGNLFGLYSNRFKLLSDVRKEKIERLTKKIKESISS